MKNKRLIILLSLDLFVAFTFICIIVLNYQLGIGLLCVYFISIFPATFTTTFEEPFYAEHRVKAEESKLPNLSGKTATVQTSLRPVGQINYQGNIFQALSIDGFVETGKKVLIIENDLEEYRVKKG